MWKHGTTKQGKVRWYCKQCKTTGIRKRVDVKERKYAKLVLNWIIDGKKLKHIAKDYGFNLQYVQAVIHKQLRTTFIPDHDRSLDSSKPLILDATWIVWRQLVVLIAHDNERVIDWIFATTENFLVWHNFLQRLEGKPLGVVSDAQKGLLQATNVRFGCIPHQRCIAHITRQARIWLTRHPKTEAGIELLALVNILFKIKDHRQKQDWNGLFDQWLQTHDSFLKEKTQGLGKKWWYTHRKLRAVRSLLFRARNEIFTYLDHNLPSTTNTLEGGINGPLKFIFKEHRGMSVEHKKQAVNLFLTARTKKKNQH
jgi:hypothetical protein